MPDYDMTCDEKPLNLVPAVRLELTHSAVRDFESRASTYFATQARCNEIWRPHCDSSGNWKKERFNWPSVYPLRDRPIFQVVPTQVAPNATIGVSGHDLHNELKRFFHWLLPW